MAPRESVASVIDLIRGMNILVKVKVMARMTESISTVKIIIDPFDFCIFNLIQKFFPEVS